MDTVPPSATPRWRFTVFTKGQSAQGTALVEKIKGVCSKYAAGLTSVEVVDLNQNPEAANNYGVSIVPTILRLEPKPTRKLIGYFPSEANLISALGINRITSFPES